MLKTISPWGPVLFAVAIFQFRFVGYIASPAGLLIALLGIDLQPGGNRIASSFLPRAPRKHRLAGHVMVTAQLVLPLRIRSRQTQ